MSHFRRSRAFHLVALLALLAQLLLPMRHAAAMDHGGDPLRLAFCGKVSGATIEDLRLNAPPELVAALGAQKARQALDACAACDHCAGLAGAHFALLPTPIVLPLPAATLGQAVADAGNRPLSRPHHGYPPPLRGPPAIT